MNERSAKEVLRHHEIAAKDRELWKTVCRDAYRYTQPARDIVDRPQRAEERNSIVFDSTGIHSGNKLNNRLQDLLFPEGKNFVELRPGPRFEEAENRDEVARGLQDINDRFHAAVWRSNFSTAINEYFDDLKVGTGAMLFNEGPDFNPFHFTAVPQFLLGLAEGPWGTVAETSRDVELNPVIARQTWPAGSFDEEDIKAGEEDPAATRHYVEMTYPDTDSVALFTAGVAPLPTRWFYAVVDKEKEKHILQPQRVYEQISPWIITRWLKAGNEVRGRGPVLNALPDIRTANKVVEFVLKNASIAVAGLWTAVDDNVFNPNTSRIVPGGVVVVGSNDGPRGPTLQPLEFPGNFDVSQLVLEELRTQIKKALFDADLPPVAGPPRTATEFIERLRELFVDIGPAAGRVQKELVEPLVMRGLTILRNKQLIDVPADLRIDGQNIEVQIVSPLAQRQNLDNVEKIVRAIELSSFLGPELVALRYKVEEIPAYIGRELGVEQSLMRDDVDAEELQAQVAEFLAGLLQQQQGGGDVPAAA